MRRALILLLQLVTSNRKYYSLSAILRQMKCSASASSEFFRCWPKPYPQKPGWSVQVYRKQQLQPNIGNTAITVRVNNNLDYERIDQNCTGGDRSCCTGLAELIIKNIGFLYHWADNGKDFIAKLKAIYCPMHLYCWISTCHKWMAMKRHCG